MDESGKYTKVTDKEEAHKHIMTHHYGAKFYKGTDLSKTMEYVVSPGVCNGDFGSPLLSSIIDLDDFDQVRNRFVIAGVASIQEGEINYCGGINHPVQYTKYALTLVVFFFF